MMITALRAGALAVSLLVPTIATVSWVGSAKERVELEARAEPKAPAAPVARVADVEYCTIELKRVLRREHWECADEVWWRPDRDVRYRPLEPADREALRARFRERGREHLLGRG